jgi:hypothetical protein
VAIGPVSGWAVVAAVAGGMPAASSALAVRTTPARRRPAFLLIELIVEPSSRVNATVGNVPSGC